MSERLTHSDVFGGILTNSEINHFGGAHTGTEVAYCGEPIDKLFEIENMCYDASGNEVISLDRLRELAEDEAKGRSTGFSDRNGTIIREHDIVRVTFYDKDFKREYVREECEVIFEKGAFGFIWGNRKEFNPLCSFCVGTVVFFEIIGHAAADAGKGE